MNSAEINTKINKITIFIIIILFELFNVSIVNSQTNQVCGIRELSQSEIQALEESFQEWLAEGNTVITDKITIIPVAFHVVRYDDGITADVTDQELYNAIIYLNNAYFPTHFRFTLRSIDRKNSTLWSQNPDLYNDNMKQELNIDPTHVLNFFTVHMSGNLNGFAIYPWDDSRRPGVAVKYTLISTTTSVHEVGHFCGLKHTFPDAGVDPCMEHWDLPDSLDDTPAQASNSDFTCEVGRNTCPELPGDDPSDNYMDYSSCRYKFTPGQIMMMDMMMSQYRSAMYGNVTVSIDQRNESNQRITPLIWIWYGIPTFVISTDLPTFLMKAGDSLVLQGFQSMFGDQKYNRWMKGVNDDPNVQNHHKFTIDGSYNGTTLISRFKKPYSNITIKNELLEAPGYNPENDNIEFKDPWFIDFPDPDYGNVLRNGDMENAVFRTRSSPFIPDFNTPYENGQKYNGVFLDQRIQDGVYYSVRAPQTVNFGGTLGVRNVYFLKWTRTPANSASFQDSMASETGVVFNNSGALVSANVKGSRFSGNSSTWQNNNQRKYIQTSDGWQHIVYESSINGINHIIYEHKPPNGDWQVEIGSYGELYVDNGGGKSPSIDWTQTDTYEPWVLITYQEGSNIRIKAYGCNTERKYYFAGADITIPTGESPSANVNPNISWHAQRKFMVTWERSSGISYMCYYLDGGYYYPLTPVNTITGTNNNSNNLAISKNNTVEEDTFYVAWEQFIPPTQGPPTQQIRYTTLKLNSDNTVTQSSVSTLSSTAMKVNSHVSIVRYPGGTRACWIADYSGTGDPMQTKAVYHNVSNPGSYYTYYYSCKSTSINKKDDNSGFYFTFSAIFTTPGWIDYNFVVSGNNLSTYTAVNTKGRDVQLCNGPSSSNMYVGSFYPSTAPYPFIHSNSLGGLGKAGMSLAGSRGVVIENNGAGLYYSLGNIAIDGKPVGFIKSIEQYDPKSKDEEYVNNNTVDSVNKLLLSEPFEIKEGSKVEFSEYSGLADSIATANLLGEKGSVSLKIELIDAATSKILGTVKESKFNKTAISANGSSFYSVKTKGIKTTLARIRAILTTDITKPVLSLIDNYTDAGEGKELAKSAVSGEIVLNAENIITEYALEQNYPNPFNPSTNITYQVPNIGHVTLKVYDVLGREVATLVDGIKESGYYTATFDGSRLSSGIYFMRLTAKPEEGKPFVQVKKMLMMK